MRTYVLWISLVVGACDGGSGATGDPPVIAGFTASPATVIASTPTAITWTWSYTGDPGDVSCTIDGVGAMESGGTSMVTLAASTTYTLRCENAGGQGTAFALLEVAQDATAPVIATLGASPMQITADVATNVTFTWTYTGVPAPSPACTLDHGIGAVTSGVAKSITLPSTTQLVLTCTNSEGSDTESVTISTVTAQVAPDLATFTADPPAVTATTDTTITWAWTYNGTPNPAPTCEIDNGVGAMTNGGTSTINIAASTTYTVTCTNAVSSDTATVTVTVN